VTERNCGRGDGGSNFKEDVNKTPNNAEWSGLNAHVEEYCTNDTFSGVPKADATSALPPFRKTEVETCVCRMRKRPPPKKQNVELHAPTPPPPPTRLYYPAAAKRRRTDERMAAIHPSDNDLACNGPRLGLETHPDGLACWTCGEKPEPEGGKTCAGFNPAGSRGDASDRWSQVCLRNELCVIQVIFRNSKKRIVRGCVHPSYFPRWVTNQLDFSRVNDDEDCSVLTKLNLPRAAGAASSGAAGILEGEGEEAIPPMMPPDVITVSMCACNKTGCNLGYRSVTTPNPNDDVTFDATSSAATLHSTDDVTLHSTDDVTNTNDVTSAATMSSALTADNEPSSGGNSDSMTGSSVDNNTATKHNSTFSHSMNLTSLHQEPVNSSPPPIQSDHSMDKSRAASQMTLNHYFYIYCCASMIWRSLVK